MQAPDSSEKQSMVEGFLRDGLDFMHTWTTLSAGKRKCVKIDFACFAAGGQMFLSCMQFFRVQEREIREGWTSSNLSSS